MKLENEEVVKMFKIIFNQNPENLFHNFCVPKLAMAQQIVIQSQLKADVIDNTTGEVVYQFIPKVEK